MSNNVIAEGKRMIAASHQNQRQGPGVKNLGPSANRKPNPQSTIRSTGQQVRGPDKGAGSS